MLRAAVLLVVAAVGSACTASGVGEPRAAQAETRLARELAGKVAGPPVKCLPSHRTSDMTIIDDNTILFRDGRNLVYRNDPPGGCSQMGNAGYTLVTRSITGQMCRGDLVHIVDLTSRITAGACSLGEFIPYRTARL